MCALYICLQAGHEASRSCVFQPYQIQVLLLPTAAEIPTPDVVPLYMVKTPLVYNAQWAVTCRSPARQWVGILQVLSCHRIIIDLLRT